MIRLAMFDMAGTTVNDLVDGLPLVTAAVKRAFARYSIELEPQLVNAQRGREKKEMIRLLWQASAGPVVLLDDVYAAFLAELDHGLERVTEMAGTSEVFRYLQTLGIKVGLGSGFPADVVDRIIAKLGWRAHGWVNYDTSAEEAGEGRPSPKMIQMAMAATGVYDPRAVIKIGDTIMDIQEGKNAGAWTIAVLTGSQTAEQLATARPDYILPSIREIPALLAAS